MASKGIKGINIKIGADTTGLDTALKDIESASKKTTSELGEINRSMRNNRDSVVLWTQKQELLTKAVENSRKKLDFLRESQEQIKKQFENKEIDEGQYRAFQREIENAKDETNKLENQLKEADTRLKELTKTTEESTEQIEELGDGIEESGQQAENSANGGYTVLGNVFANLITDGIKLAWNTLKNFTQDVVATGMEYESAISNVVAISGAMAEEVEMLQAKAEEMGATTKFTAAESAEAMGYMAMAGWKVNDMVSGLDGIMDLSAASGENLASVSDIVTDALTAFGLQASDSAHFADVLAAASSNANTNVAMMGETFTYAAPVAGALGFSIEDTAEAIGLMANSGIKASQAGTSLRTILTQLSGNITLIGEKLGDFVVKTANADGSMREFSDILDDLRTGWIKLTEAEQSQNAETIVGKNAMSGFLALMNSAPADIEKLSSAIENADGTAKNMASTMLDNLEGDKTLFSSAFDGVKIAISKELNPALRDLTQYATNQMPKIQKAIEPLADFVTKAIKAVPRLVENLQKFTPVLTSIGTAIGIIGISKIAENLINKLIPAVKLTYTAISAHPFIAVFTAVTAAGVGLAKYLNKQAEEKTEIELLIEKHNAEIEVLHDKRRAIEDLNDAFYENVDGIQNQTDRTKDLWNELDKLADQYGNVQQKDKTRAEYILNELNEALGTEYTMTGNQIENYKLLSAEIDNVIAKKQAEMMLDAYLANSTEMTKQRIEARTDYENADKNYDEQKKALKEAEQAFSDYKRDFMNKSDISAEDYFAGNFSDTEMSTHKGYELAKSVIIAREELQQAKNARTQAKRNYEATSEYFEKLDDLQEAYSLGQYDRMAEIIYAEKDLASTTLDESATDAEQRLQIYSDSLKKTLSDFDLTVKDMKQKSVDEMEKVFSDTMQKALQAGVDPAEVWSNFKEKDFYALQANGLDISPLITPLVESGATPAEIFGNGWKDVFRTQLKNGGDMESMLKWLDNSGYYNSNPLIFGNNGDFLKYIKQQLSDGQSVDYLLEWGVNSGLATSEEFVDIFKSTVEKNLENGVDVGNLLEWGNKAGIDLGEVFGEKFGANWQKLVDSLDADITEFIKWGEKSGFKVSDIFSDEYIDNFQNYLNSVDGDLDVDAFMTWANSKGLLMGDIFGENFIEKVNEYLDSANNSINEVSDNINNQIYGPLNKADMLAQKGRLVGPIPFMADGGFLHSGQAVVAEAGPELLEVMNGGVKVTPLTRSAQNTSVSGGVQNVYYSNYTINATISGSYDVRRLAEDLETEKQRCDNGRGVR
ncbi:MAG: phage tail tape measure protein [Ruminococcus sp.]|nr:phage tail tape measure protein [Ruminococcus sp.]